MDELREFLNFTVIGLGNGAIYAMIGLGLVVIFRATSLLNFAQGEIALFSTYLTWQFFEWGLPLALALLCSMAASFVLGVVLFRVCIEPLGDIGAKPLPAVIITIGLFLGINAVCQRIWGSEDLAFPALFGDGSVNLFDIDVKWQKIGSLAVLAVLAGLLFVLFRLTRVGLFMRASASNPQSSALSGISVNAMLGLGWGIAATLGAVAGAFAAPDRGLGLSLMLLPLVYAFAAITIGGFDSFVGAIVGGLIVGVIADVMPRYVSWMEKMPLFPVFVLVLLVLLVRPNGLFGSKKVVRV